MVFLIKVALSKTAKEPGEKHRLEPYFNFGGRKFFNRMNRKKVFVALFTIFAIGIVGHFALVKNQAPTSQTQQVVFASQEDCEQKTGKSCTFQMCDYIPPGKTFEEVCGKDFKKGWVHIISVTTNQQQPITEPKSVPFEKVNLHSDWRLKSSFNYSTYKGIFRNENELKKVFGSMVNAYDELQAFWEKKHEPQPVMPVIDFSKYSVIWYADRGSNASFTTLKEVLEYDDFIEARVTPFYSDFGSSHLNLWTIPKTDKDIRFVETKEYEQRGP